MNNVQILVIGRGYLDLLDTTNFPLVINKSIADISDISARDSFYSYDFEIPNNANNNKILFGVEYVNAVDRTILGKQDAIIYYNSNEYERGFIEVKISKYMDKYLLNFFGGNAEWVELGNDVLVKDLGFSPNITVFNSATVSTQNSGTALNRDYAFPSVDRNTLPTDTLSARPVFYVKSIFERFFASIGYTIDSNFLNSKFVVGEIDSLNKGLAVDLVTNYEFEDSVITDTFVEVKGGLPSSISSPYYLYKEAHPSTASRLTSDYRGYFNDEISDDFDLWSSSGYTVPRNGNYLFNFDFRNSGVTSSQLIGSTQIGSKPEIILEIRKDNGLPFIVQWDLIDTVVINSLVYFTGVISKKSIFLNENDIIGFRLVWNGKTLDGTDLSNVINSTYGFSFYPNNAKFNIQQKSKIEEGDSYAMSSVIPKDMKAIELISDFKLLFNLYFDADVKTKVVKIEPRNDWKDADFEDVLGYYKSVGLARNWTNLIDLNFAPEISTEMQYNRSLKFRYKPDADDKWLQQWERNNNRTYAEYTQDLGNRFPNGETTFETTLLAPTIQGTSNGLNTSIIRSEFKDLTLGIDATQPSPNNKYAPRIGWFVNDVFIMEAFNGTTPFESTATKLTFNGVSGLIDKFWSKTIQNLINAVKLKVNVNLSKTDLRNFDFSTPVYIDAPQQIKGYYVVQNIETNMMSDELVKVELLYYKDFAPLVIDSSQATNINPNKQDQQTSAPQYVVYEIDGILINVLEEIDNGNLVTLIYQ
jgi:hypothetical protein